jgi:ankyrin repeat protein
MSKRLPPNPSLRSLQNQAKQLLKAYQSGSLPAAESVRGQLSRFAGSSDAKVLSESLTLRDMQHVIAREYGFDQWTDLKWLIQSRAAKPGSTADQRASLTESLRIYTQGRRDIYELLRSFRAGEGQASERVHAAHQASANVRTVMQQFGLEPPTVTHPHNAQEIIAHEQNGSSWAAMCLDAVNRDAIILDPAHPFIVALRENQLTDVGRYLQSEPELANCRVRGGGGLEGEIYEMGADGPTPVTDDEPRTATPLHHAALLNKVELARLLIESGADVDSLGFTANCDVSTPFCMGAFDGVPEMFRLLLEAGANPNLAEGTLARKRDETELLLKHGETYNIFTATNHGDVPKVAALLDEQPDRVHERCPWMNRTPIEGAFHHGQLEMARYLIERGATVTPPIHIALGNLNEVRAIVERDDTFVHRQVSEQDEDTPLIKAVGSRQVDMVKYLLSVGADPNVRGADVTPLIAARGIPVEAIGIVSELIESGANVSEHFYGQTYLSVFLRESAFEVAELFLQSGADVEQKSKGRGGKTALQAMVEPGGGEANRLARKGEFIGPMQFLLDHGADINALSEAEGKTALDFAIKMDAEPVADFLRERGGKRAEDLGFGDHD